MPDSVHLLSPFPHLTPPLAPVFLIDPLGFAAEEGLSVTIEDCGIPSAAYEGVESGRGDLCFVNTVFAFLETDKGNDLIPFSAYVRHQNRAFVVPEGSPARTLDDLKGTTVGLFALDHKPFARATLMSEGIEADREVSFKVYRHKGSYEADEMVEALRDGTLSSIWLLDVLVGHFEATGIPLRRLPATTVDALTPSACLFSTRKRLQERGGVLARLARAVAKGCVFCAANPDVALKLAWRNVPTSAPKAGEEDYAYRRDIAALRTRLENQRVDDTSDGRWGYIPEDGMANWQEFMLNTGAIGTRRPATAYFTNDYADAINDFDAGAVVRMAKEHAID